MQPVDELDGLITRLRNLGIGAVFEDAELRRACSDSLKSWGCPTLVARLIVEAIAGLATFCEEGITTNASRRLLRIAGATRFGRSLLDRIIAGAGGLSDKIRLKDQLIRSLRGETVQVSVPTDQTTDLEIIKFLYEKQERDALVQRVDAAIAQPLHDISVQLEQLFGDLYEPKLFDPRGKLRHPGAGESSLLARAERDTFQERKDDLDFLDRFLGDPTARGSLHRFRWALVTGPGGEGKTRLALEFLGVAEARLFRAGFLPLSELRKLDPFRWRPRWASLLVVDYPAQSPQAAADLLSNFAERASDTDSEFEFPVRVLLLEREAKGVWFETILPPDSRGALVREFCFSGGPYQLGSLSRDSLVAIMQGRLSGIPNLDGAVLYQLLLQVDTNCHQEDGGWRCWFNFTSMASPFFDPTPRHHHGLGVGTCSIGKAVHHLHVRLQAIH